MTELEEKIKAKIPGPDTGIEIKHSLCAICSPGHHCGVDCYVKDGKIIRVEGTPEHPYNHGHLCTKGSALRNAVYREDRIKTPLRRVGQRGEGKFEPISWDEAYQTIARKLDEVKEQYGPNSVAFLSGYCKWYRPILHRFAHVFGSVNFGTDDSTCSAAMVIANKVTAGTGAGPDMAHANTFLGWNFDGYYSAHLSVLGVQKLKERGGQGHHHRHPPDPGHQKPGRHLPADQPGHRRRPGPGYGQADYRQRLGRYGLCGEVHLRL